MTAKLLDILISLTAIIADETAKLRSAGARTDRAELVAAKARLVSQLDGHLLEFRRDDSARLRNLHADVRATLAAGFARLHEVTTANGEALQRQLDLSAEMMEAVAAEARRLLGTRTSAYSALGELWRADGRAPISLNASL